MRFLVSGAARRAMRASHLAEAARTACSLSPFNVFVKNSSASTPKQRPMASTASSRHRALFETLRAAQRFSKHRLMAAGSRECALNCLETTRNARRSSGSANLPIPSNARCGPARGLSPGVLRRPSFGSTSIFSLPDELGVSICVPSRAAGPGRGCGYSARSAVRGCPATGLPAQACRWRNAAGAMDLSLPQRTARSVGAGESGLLASFMLGLLVSYRR